MGLCPIPTGRVVSPHLPLSFQGMKNNEEDIMHAPGYGPVEPAGGIVLGE